MKTLRSILTVLTAACAVALFAPGGAMATKGSCNPAPDPFNNETYSLGGGQVLIQTTYGWDGVSVFPDCIGAVESVHIVNQSQINWYVTLPSNRRGSLSFRATPGTDKTYTSSQLAVVGIQTNQDLAGCVWGASQPAGLVLNLP